MQKQRHQSCAHDDCRTTDQHLYFSSKKTAQSFFLRSKSKILSCAARSASDPMRNGKSAFLTTHTTHTSCSNLNPSHQWVIVNLVAPVVLILCDQTKQGSLLTPSTEKPVLWASLLVKLVRIKMLGLRCFTLWTI